jgi:hypothetical protein
MKKYYIIKNLETGLYLAPMSTEFTAAIEHCGSWSDEQSAIDWIKDIKFQKITIIPMWINYTI